MFIYKGEELLYYRHFGKALKREALEYLISEIMEEESYRGEDRVEFHDYYKFRVSYITQKSLGVIVLFVTGLTDKFDNIKKELLKCRKEFVNLFEEILQHRFDSKTFEVFDPIVDTIHKNLRPKISLVGFSGVGKTTITKLIRAEEIPMKHIPTITGDIATVRIGKLYFHLWDFAGQEQFSYLWNNFIKGSDAALLVTDSTLENVEKSKFFLELIKEESPNAHAAVIGNKQDLKGAINPAQIEKILGLKAYSMIAKDPENRDKMIQIIADILEMSAEISPLLKPLLERDKLIEEATRALKSADFEKAAFLFDKISYLCIDLGDDSLGKEFFEKSQKIKTMLEQVETPQPTPAYPIGTDRTEQLVTSEKPKITIGVIESEPEFPFEATEKQKSPAPELPPTRPIKKQPLDEVVPELPKEKLKSSVDWIASNKTIPVQNKVMGSEFENKDIGLKLNPEDFMVKIRPKTIVSVPKDAKSKLKTSAFGHVKNMPSSKEAAIISQPKSENSELIKIIEEMSAENPPSHSSELFRTDTQMISTQPSVSHEPIKSKIIPKEIFPETAPKDVTETIKSGSTIDNKQIDHAKKTLIELKLKEADLNKIALDFEMKELKGEITEKELNDKMKKVEEYKKKIENQIRDMQKFLKD
ncbi:MAG: ADP-ribosylation factor-like protein [Candidatus Thorarchaeota archaeon]